MSSPKSPGGYQKPLTLAVTSGKGGVGKTRIAMAVACEFALKYKTLLVDLDFFNRGLRGLMPDSQSILAIDTPALLVDSPHLKKALKTRATAGGKDHHIEDRWHIHKVISTVSKDNFYFLHYPDLTEGQVMAFVSCKLDDLQQAIAAIIKTAVMKCGIEVVILDCHGGPDNTSFAACLEADQTLLIAEPETASLNGTFNFIRQLEYAAPERKKSISLVFNKVKEKTSFKFLNLLSEKYISKKIGGKGLLAAFPVEPKLDRFANVEGLFPFLLPNSLLVRKTKAMLVDLAKEPRFAPYIKKLPILKNRYINFLRRRSMRDVPRFLNSVIYLKFLAYFGSVALVYGALVNRGILKETDLTLMLEGTGLFLLYIALGMLIISLWIQLSVDAKTRAVVAARSKKAVPMALNVLAITVVWLIPALLISTAYESVVAGDWYAENDSAGNVLSVVLIIIVSGVYFSYVGKAFFDVWRGKYEAHTRRERVVNLSFALVFLFLPVVLYFTEPQTFFY